MHNEQSTLNRVHIGYTPPYTNISTFYLFLDAVFNTILTLWNMSHHFSFLRGTDPDTFSNDEGKSYGVREHLRVDIVCSSEVKLEGIHL